MKTKIPLLVSMMLLLFVAVACTEEELLIESSETTPVRSRAEVGYNNESLTNKNLFDDWENVTRIELNSTSGAIDTNSVIAPWVEGTSTALSESFCKDIKKADGWVMLFHTFKAKGLDNYKNYICLYNKFTGVIKVFYYNELGDFGSSLTYWNLSSTKPLRLMDAPSYFTKPNDAAPANSSLSFTNEVNTSAESKSDNHGLIKAWNGFTYQVPSYFNEDYDCSITISALDKFVTLYEFSGQTQNKITGTITSITSSDKNVANGTARQGEISRYGKEALGFMNFLEENANKQKDNNNKNVPLQVSKDLMNLLSGITQNKYFTVFKNGLNKLFNRSTVSTYYTTSDVRLESQGHLLIKGTSEMTTSSPVYNVRFNLKDVINGTVPSGSGLVLSSEGIGLENLGTWTIKSIPTIYYERISPVYPLSYTITHNEWDRVEVTGNVVLPPYHYTTPELIINKDLQQYVTYSNLTMELVGCIKADNQYYGSWYEISHDTNHIYNGAFSNDIYNGFETPTIYSDEINHIYSVPKGYVKMSIRTPFTSEQINDKVYNMYYDWGTILRGRMIALVTAEIHYNYNGKTIKTLETRSYPVKYGYTNEFPPEYYHNPPHDFVINYKCPQRQDLELYYGNNPSLVP